MKKILAIVIFGSLYAVPSSAIVDVGIVGGLSQMAEPTISSSTTNYNVTANTGRSYGLMAQFHSSFGLGVSLGLLYTEVNFHELVTNGGSTISNTDTLVPYYQVPLIINYWFGGILAFGAGGYYGLPGGNVSIAGTSGSFATQNYKSDDFGFVGDFQIRVPIGIVTYLSATALYEYGIENVSTQSGLTSHNQGFVFLAGFGFGI